VRRFIPAKTDANARELDREADFFGISILPLDPLGKGKPDRLFAWKGRACLVEYKNPESRRGRGECGANSAQSAFARQWTGCPVYVAKTRNDVARIAVELKR
jgi:hypothetical protein